MEANQAVEAVGAVTSVLYGIAHILAIVGKPKFLQKIAFLSVIVDAIGANYGKSRSANSAPK